MNIVLAHGILGFDQIGPMVYFNEVKEHLENQHGANVLVTRVDATASIKNRGNQLRQKILDAFNHDSHPPLLNPDTPTHIIAHSMGGLDSRFILSPQNPENISNLITSLTTIGTPHKGSPLADLVYQALDGRSDFRITEFAEKEVIESLYKLGISTEGLRDLTTSAMEGFNQIYTDNPKVRYFCTAGIGRDKLIKTSLALLPGYTYIKESFDEANDGAVPLSSAMRGEPIGNPWFADHLDEVGHDLNDLPNGKPDNFDYLVKYDEIIEKLRTIPLR